MTLQNLANLKEENFELAPVYKIEGENCQKHYEKLLRGFMHRLSNMLAVTQGFSRLIMMNDDLDIETQENLKHMHEASVSAGEFCEQILAAAGLTRIAQQSLDIVNFLKLTKDSILRPLKENEVAFEYNISPDVPYVRADGSNLRDLLLILLSNASESASETRGGMVIFELLSPGQLSLESDKRADILITNFGTSVSKSEMTKIFEPFYTNKKRNHAGVGLTIASAIANSMNCKLGVHSDEKSTSFWLSIPFA